MQYLQRTDMLRGQLPLDGDCKVNIAVIVEIPKCERALQVRTDEITAQYLPDPGYQLIQDIVELRIGCRSHTCDKAAFTGNNLNLQRNAGTLRTAYLYLI